MMEKPGINTPSVNSPPVGAAISGWEGMLAALMALVLVAIAAFWQIGTRPREAPIIIAHLPTPATQTLRLR